MVGAIGGWGTGQQSQNLPSSDQVTALSEGLLTLAINRRKIAVDSAHACYDPLGFFTPECNPPGLRIHPAGRVWSLGGVSMSTVLPVLQYVICMPVIPERIHVSRCRP
jgi:hypothetical protein